MPIEIKELKVNIQVRDKSISVDEIEKIVQQILSKKEEKLKENFIQTFARKDRINKNR
jgi:hypothetical protein